jgi:hypothetical protein
MRKFLIVAGALALAGCVTGRPTPPSGEELKARADQAAADCRAQPLTTYVQRAQCLNQAAMIAAPVAENPDLLQRALAARLDIATRVDTKDLTPAEGAKRYAKIEADLAAEAKKRAEGG